MITDPENGCYYIWGRDEDGCEDKIVCEPFATRDFAEMIAMHLARTCPRKDLTFFVTLRGETYLEEHEGAPE
jgi:hypothetical protein